jgi:hypothetical protein
MSNEWLRLLLPAALAALVGGGGSYLSVRDRLTTLEAQLVVRKEALELQQNNVRKIDVLETQLANLEGRVDSHHLQRGIHIGNGHQ